MRSDNDPSCQTQLLEYLGAKRYRRADRLVQLLKTKGPSLRKKLRRVAKGVAKDGTWKSGKSTRKAATKQSAQVLDLTAGLSDPPSLNKSNLHPYRLKVKELRDALRMAGGTGDSRFAAALGRSKDAIGEWHDWEELIAIAAKVLDHGPHCPLLQELKDVSKRKFESALARAEKLRADYARPPVDKRKTKKTSSAPSKIPERALKAVAGVVR